MRFFRVVLKVAGPVFIEADRYEQGENLLLYRDEEIFAHYSGDLVEEIAEVDRLPEMTSFFSSEAQGD
ncbi:hypothetical protein DES53_11514 [Roseimicrobium gellanilyticum]|uniref:Uncharacterized protein n=1 Tax=Roseimicrobium gellanilyticum TaxID=748857 RepID=A0A366H4D5_9BACT|nr:hypothetical protein [Roseimicrobium gellanilyticum]RBP36873.1 hypothetical protein DES53_11514 [Roseimicrobium gellanilyticum]